MRFINEYLCGMKRSKKILLGLAVILLVIQFIRPTKNSSSQSGDVFFKDEKVDAKTAAIFKTSCFDCHSNNTIYPWYTEIQPVGWWLQHHVDEGKAELNFDAYSQYSPRRKFHKLEEIEEMLTAEEMPLPSYLILHGDAKLSVDQKKILVDWSKAMRDSMKAHYPADSLKMLRR
jgi:Haem-binding domain